MKQQFLFLVFCILFAQLDIAEDIEISVGEGELLNISNQLQIFDPDGDKIETIFSPPLNEKGLWQTNYDDVGIYYTNITVSDGINDIVQTLKITVKNNNREPIIEEIFPVIDNLTIKELETINFEVKAIDPDKDKLYYSWKLDNEELSANSKFTYETD